MKDKQTAAAQVRKLIARGEMTTDDLQAILNEQHVLDKAPEHTKEVPKKSKKPAFSAIDSMFAVGGILLFAAIQVLINQLFDGAASGFLGMFFSIVIAAMIWGVAALQARKESGSGIVRGVVLAFSLTGSLLWVAAAVYLTIEIERATMVYSSDPWSSPAKPWINPVYVLGVSMLGVALLHVGYWRLVRRLIVSTGAIASAYGGMFALLFGSVGSEDTMHYVVGASLVWGGAWLMLRYDNKATMLRDMINAFSLAGSLLLTGAAAYLARGLTLAPYGNSIGLTANQLYIFGVSMLGVTLFHAGFIRLVRLAVVAGATIVSVWLGLSAIMFGALLATGITSLDARVAVCIGSGVLLYMIARMATKFVPNLVRASIFNTLAQFIILVSMTVGTYGGNSFLWYVLIIGAVLGLFYVSIVQKSQPSLALAAFFLIITLISMAFRYFSGMGVAFSLLMAAMAVLGVATVAVTIHKKYLT